jgi:MOSC domain-containing protein
LTVHGGVDKAVYSYPAEHYDYWLKQFRTWISCGGMFGENFTTDGLMEEIVNIGDQLQIDSSRGFIHLLLCYYYHWCSCDISISSTHIRVKLAAGARKDT